MSIHDHGPLIRYTKALEVIKKLHKDQAQEIKTYKLKLENLQTLKDAEYKEAADPFEYCDIVTTTTHKSLRGPRAGMIFYRKGPKPAKKGQPEDAVYDFEDKINFSVFPSLQGGPHNHQIGALAVALKQSMSPGFKAYAKQVKANAVALGKFLMSKGYKLVTEGTENHLV